ncbi:Shugoshin [Colletotrichum chlorophyti]|uniref:Shugoshin n=1 Tax=Colletotrichum chlorophyti TaxID=708187 RepID=A0A1Q8S1I7_9PEZI|nr:Shugoshin [Colletotrichum chlorophyti]
MARLNEPPVSADSIDTLRRKLLRQNRDLAKANVVHLARIRSLEADFARSLSENLELNGRIIELEKELENSNARRIADHSLDIKSKLESQLMDCLSVLANLGQEPPTKRHASPRGRRLSRQSLPHRSPPLRRPPREPTKDTEARALQEGRLPPIAENKSYPRATMDREQILALCSEAAGTTDTTDSPELGPPPLSRFVDTDCVDNDPPHQPPETFGSETTAPTSPLQSPSPAPPLPAPAARVSNKIEKTLIVRPDPTPQSNDARPESRSSPKETSVLPPVAVAQVGAKTGSKRKYNMGDELSKTSKSTAEATNPEDIGERLVVGRERQSGKTLKELANMRREARERMSAPGNPRKPLSAKSTNDDVTSPVKNAKATTGDCVLEKPKPRAARQRAAQKIKESEAEAEVTEVPCHPLQPAQIIDVLPSTETVPLEAALLSPASPEPTSRMSLSSVRDTPPPADISSHGETSRPSRRARAAISYAEPNLRDKMRRPTKELYDAVSGQTRYLQRSGSANSEQLTEEGSTMIKRESTDGDVWKQMAAAASPSPKVRQRGTASHEPADKLEESATTTTKPDRKKRTSSMMSGSISETEGQRLFQQTSGHSASPEEEASGQPTPSPESEVDPYEFTSSTPGSDTSRIVELKEKAAPARQSKSSRRLSSAVREDVKVDGDGSERSKSGGPRKRASMVLPKRVRAETDGLEDSSFESVEGGAFTEATSKVSMRRRSMML